MFIDSPAICRDSDDAGDECEDGKDGSDGVEDAAGPRVVAHAAAVVVLTHVNHHWAQ